MIQLSNLNIEETIWLTPPVDLKKELPMSVSSIETIHQGRETIRKVLSGKDKRKIIIVGPCSIHNVDEAMLYAEKLHKLSEKVKKKFLILMRVYFEKPRSTIGWKGLINDPHLDSSFDIERGLRLARNLLIDISEMGLNTATEFLDFVTPQYIDELITWAAIGARTTESQVHRQMASGFSMPVGFKNTTNGNIDIAINAIESSRSPHHFIGIDGSGDVSIFKTRGNKHTHLILRGGDKKNYDKKSVELVQKKLTNSKINSKIIVDCSHGNSEKDHKKQVEVFMDVINQIKKGNKDIVGLMLESNLSEGNQKVSKKLKKGVSVTDACIGWKETEKLILDAYKKIK
jgi:3-deoxy-7-phosphoheptulonate synthase